MNSVGYDRSSHSGLHSPPPNSSYQFLSDCGARRQAIDLFVLSPHLFPPHPVASALQGRVVPLKVKLGGNGPTGQSSGGAGRGKALELAATCRPAATGWNPATLPELAQRPRYPHRIWSAPRATTLPSPAAGKAQGYVTQATAASPAAPEPALPIRRPLQLGGDTVLGLQEPETGRRDGESLRDRDGSWRGGGEQADVTKRPGERA